MKWIIGAGLALLASAAIAQVGGLGFPGPGPRQSTAPTTCGTGVIDLSTGCTQPMLGGL